MRVGRSYFAIAVVLLLGTGLARGAGEDWHQTFDGAVAWRADSVLSSAALEGRKSGTPGGRAAEEWIAGRFSAAGLRPGARDGSFFQSFPVIGFEPGKSRLVLLESPFGKIPLVEGDDYALLLTPARGRVTAEAVFVGFGIDAPAKGRDDYAGLDIAGKIAVIVRGRPEDGQDWEEEYRRTHTFAAAVRHGAAAVLYYQGRDAVAGAALEPGTYRSDRPGAYISERVVRLLLRETGWRLEDLQEKLKEGPLPFSAGKRMEFEVDLKGRADATGRNLLGMIRGSDPALGTEVVLIGAHQDHIGRDGAGRIYPGANDNASGTAVVMEMARAAVASGWTPRRTVYFVALGGEEQGLLGAKALAADLPFDSTRLVAMINIDMAGHGDGGFGVAGGPNVGPAYFAWRAGIDSAMAASFEEYQLHGEGSDFFPFAERGVPAITAWSRGDHSRYHDIEDRPRYVRRESLEGVGRGVGSLLQALADHPEPLRDGLGRERALRVGAAQVSFAPLDAARLGGPSRDALDGGGRIAGRIVRLDAGREAAAEILGHLGRMRGLVEGRDWLRVAAGFDAAADGWGSLRTTLLPFVSARSLDRLGFDAVRSLCAAGLAGAIWSDEKSPPPAPICDALAKEGRPLLATSGVAWRELAAREPDLDLVIRYDRPGVLPTPPDSGAAQVLLVLPIEGIADTTLVLGAASTWGERRVHLDITKGLEAGVRDAETLRFVGWMRARGWSDERIERVLGRNLAEFGGTEQ